MATQHQIPCFAVLGHPNEGKSSVVSTLTENDQIPVSRIPGETTRSRTHTVSVDGEPVISFVDTPGFQVPRQTLEWFRKFSGNPSEITREFIAAHKEDPFFADECQLFAPVAQGAGIIYVVDGSRPVRPDDLVEMEILRLTGSPRMAVINSKASNGSDMGQHIDQWAMEFRKHFNAIRTFNSNTANFRERIRMLESLTVIDQQWEQAMKRVVEIFREEMYKRNRLACANIIYFLETALSLTVSAPISSLDNPQRIREKLEKTHRDKIRNMEENLFSEIRSLFKHNLYEVDMEENDIFSQDLFAKETWEALGLKKSQLAAAGALLGGGAGAIADVAAQGLSFGIFTVAGGLLGAGSALMGGKKLANLSFPNTPMAGDRLQIGPNRNIQFLFVLLDRALLYYAQIIKRPHGKRDDIRDTTKGKQGFSAAFSSEQRSVCMGFFKSLTGKSLRSSKNASQNFAKLIQEVINDLSRD